MSYALVSIAPEAAPPGGSEASLPGDADLNHAIVRGIKRRQPTVDFRGAHRPVPEGMQDTDVLALAAREGRILVSHDFRTIPRHFHEFVQDHSGPGVFLIRVRPHEQPA